MNRTQKRIHIILWLIIFALSIYIIFKGIDIIKDNSFSLDTGNIKAGLSAMIDKKAVETYMPAFLFSVDDTEEADSLETILVRKVFESVPIYDFLKDSQDYSVAIENDSTYEMILAAEGYDEDIREPIDDDTDSDTMTAEADQQENSESSEPEIAAIAPVADISMEKLNDFEYLLNNFYIVDKMTTVDSDLLNAAKFMENDLSIEVDESEPQILIYHSHSQEEFIDSIPGDTSTTIVGVGDYLTELLTEQYGFNVIHHTGVYDLVDGVLDRNNAYTLAGNAVQQILDENPSVQVVIDLHRDGVEGKKFVTDINGKPTARFMFLNGISRSAKNGDISYLPNPYINDNLSFSFQLQLKAEQYFPGLMRGTYIRALRYNLHFRPRTLLIESGTQLNTVQEQKNAMEPIAEILNQVLRGE